VGHFFRALEICRALAGNDVILVTGGPPVNVALPPHVREFHLPGLMTDRNYDGLFPVDGARSLAAVKSERRRMLHELFRREAPAVTVIELYPFGRKAFRFELDPVLEDIRKGVLPPSRVYCSLRDILVEKSDPTAYEERVVRTLNRWFDGLLVHADPNLVRLDDTFSRVADLQLPLIYTGYVAQAPLPGAGKPQALRSSLAGGDFRIVASAGGGKAGIVLLEPLLESVAAFDFGRKMRLQVFTGPFMPEEEFARLQSFAGDRISVQRFSDGFLALLADADLSVSMAGYNTCMNILATGVPALVWPYPGDREQGLRARKLARCGALQVLAESDLQPASMAAAIQRCLHTTPSPRPPVDLNGAARTAELIRGSGLP
jgi:predicted glycosyltransferase